MLEIQLYLKNLTLGIVFICTLLLGIVYCFSKKDSVSISSSLMSRGIKTACYHGDLDGPSRSYVHNAWMKNAIQVQHYYLLFALIHELKRYAEIARITRWMLTSISVMKCPLTLLVNLTTLISKKKKKAGSSFCCLESEAKET